MSLLLDALKKAALDKRRHDLQNSSLPIDDEADTPQESNFQQESAFQQENVDERNIYKDYDTDEEIGRRETDGSISEQQESLTFEIEFPDQDVHTATFTVPTETKPVQVNIPRELEQPLSELSNGSAIDLEEDQYLEDRESKEIIDEGEHLDSLDEAQFSVSGPSVGTDDAKGFDRDNEFSEQVSVQECDDLPETNNFQESSTLQQPDSLQDPGSVQDPNSLQHHSFQQDPDSFQRPERIELAIVEADGSTIQNKNSYQQERKAALAQLIKSSQTMANRNRRRKLLLLGGLLLTSFAIVALYYYYLLPADNFQTSLMARSTELDNIQNGETDIAYESTDEEMESTLLETEQVNQISELENIDETSNDVGERDNNILTNLAKGQSVVTPLSTAELSQTKNSQVTVKEADTNPLAPKSPTPKDSAPKPSAPKPKDNPATTANNGLKSEAAKQSENYIKVDAKASNPFGVAIDEGYKAYQAGKLNASELAYQRALALSPNHRDALLGAAAVAFRQGKFQQALHYYQQRLARAPNDTYAQSGILSIASIDLSSGGQSSVDLESEVNKLLADYPQAAHLHFLKGSIHAEQRQWGNAQLSFFEAWRWDKTKPDYVYNLAIALDHLNQTKEALRLYRQALAMNETSVNSFNLQQLQQRISQLEEIFGGEKP